MKLFFRFIVCISCSICIFLSPFLGGDVSARADAVSPPEPGAYACVLQKDVFFYSEREESRGLFLLPKTYYVKLLEYGEEYCKIEYGAEQSPMRRLIGYAKTSQLAFVDYIPVRPYLSYTFDVSYTIEEDPLNDSAFLSQITVNCVYYGDYEVGSKSYCYVLRGEEFGYIPKPASLRYEENDEYANRLAASSDKTPEKEEGKEESSSPAQVGILIALCLLVPLLAALILKPPRRPPYDTDE